VTRYVLKDTLGRIPLFQGQWLDPEFQSDLFPLIKPVSYQPGEVILKRGEPSLELLFLLSGEVSVLSAYTINRVCSRLTPTEEIIFSNEPTPQKVMALKHMGAFGATVLTGRRCTATHLANTSVHVHMLSNTDIAFIFKKNPRMCRRVKTVLLAEVARKERMKIIFMRFLISSLRVIREEVIWKRNGWRWRILLRFRAFRRRLTQKRRGFLLRKATPRSMCLGWT
jgi:CRP-like cAMP-binding protein